MKSITGSRSGSQLFLRFPLLSEEFCAERCLKYSICRNRFFASASVRYVPNERLVFSDSTTYFPFIFLIIEMTNLHQLYIFLFPISSLYCISVSGSRRLFSKLATISQAFAAPSPKVLFNSLTDALGLVD